MTKIGGLLGYVRFYALAAVAVAGAVVLILVFWLKVVAAHRQFLQKNEDYALLAAKLANLLQLRRENESARQFQKRLRDAFLAGDTVVGFIEFIEETGRGTGNKIVLSNVSESDQGRDFRVALSGSYPGLVNFLMRLESSPYLARVLKVDSSRLADSAGGESFLQTNLTIRALSL